MRGTFSAVLMAALLASSAACADGALVVGCSETGKLMPFFPDFARLAMRLNARIIPAGIAGGAALLPVGSRIPRRKTMNSSPFVPS